MIIIAIKTPTLSESSVPPRAVCFDGIGSNFVRRLPDQSQATVWQCHILSPGSQSASSSRSGQKRNREQRSVPLLPVLYPPQGTLLLLLQDQVRSRGASHGTCGGAGRNSGSVRIEVQYSVFFRAEPTNTSLVENQGRSADTVSHVGGGRGYNDAYSVNRVTALTASGDVIRQGGIKQTRSRAGRTARGAGLHAGARSQCHQRRRIAHRRIRCQISHFRCVDGANCAHRGRLVSRDTSPQQVRNSDRSDDQNDRHHDQQLN